MKRLCLLLFFAGLLLIPAVVNGQVVTGPAATETVLLLPNAGHFFVALISGLVLAIAFQLILTNLSVAAGLNIVGPVDEGGEPGQQRDEGQEAGAMARKITTGFGLWTLITASVALFFASWLAVALSLSVSLLVGAVLGVVIWGLFYIIMMLVQAKAISSLVGYLIGVATSGLRAAYDATTSLFSRPQAQAAETATLVASKVRDELFGDMDTQDVMKRIGEYVERLAPPKPRDLRKELASLLSDVEIKAITTAEGPAFDRDKMITTLQAKSGMDADKAKASVSQVEEAINRMKEEQGSAKDRPSKIADMAMRAGGLSHEEAESFRKNFEDYLRKTGKSELNPEGIKRDIEKLFSDPKGGMEALKARLEHVDKDTIAAIISQRSDISKDQVTQVIDRITSTIDGLRGKAHAPERESAMQKIQQYMDSLGRPELRYEGVRHDMELLFSDPKAGADALVHRLRAIDRDTIKAVLASRRDISDEDAEHILDRIETARDNVIKKAEQMNVEIQLRLAQTKQQALHQAEEARKTAATAGWWAFGTAVVSGIAAMIGGMVAVATSL